MSKQKSNWFRWRLFGSTENPILGFIKKLFGRK